jgi:uncharacterized protein
MKALKVPFLTVLFVFICLLAFSKLAGLTSLNNSNKNVFHTQGTGKATAAPDIASVTVGITQDALVVKDAQNKVNEATSKIIADLKKLGINEKDIKTQNYSVNPKYNYYVPTRNKPDGYTVSQEMEIKSKSIDKINKVIDVATADGANIVNGANFTFSDELQKKLENKAREDAVKDAKQKAETLSKAAGMNLGKVIDITESNNRFYPIPMMKTATGLGTSEEAQDLAAPTTQVSPGENTVNVTVDITYEVR